ncbi:damage-control phosphatase ARMT1 family protein [Actinacidiphila sp. ITFR-21]|uniref:damage-control phosphatase ARMT1 family protein n=1 Tax=Actinacidiphila sp. ITFR-21 TaxID=3075199 RepID=UPI00288A3109|nr:damage-control phosphatase ARMT1 family protein [Streptomyces sp. ITFR-21]WNI16366.1 damage-control phosphatase ARMT1 family protein [Streptomyces sp. ITFR-21]
MAPATVVTATPGSFARGVLTERHPALIRQVRDAFPYGPGQRRALEVLLEESAGGGPIGAVPEGWDEGYAGRSWFEVPFLWAEGCFYWRLLDAVGYFGAGPWQGIDPFGPAKRAELRGSAVAEELAALDGLTGLPTGARDRAVLHGSLWGNRADLGFRISAAAPTAAPTAGQTASTGAGAGAGAQQGQGPAGVRSVLVDDGDPLWKHAVPGGTVYVLADNAGRELIADLVLIDHLLHTGRAATVVLHVKPHPYFVSDATTADVVDCLRRIGEAEGRAGRVGGRLWQAMADGRLSVRAHPFSCAPLPYADMPADLRNELARATLVLAKGDLNYRRLVGDRHWPATTPFADRTAYFPGAALAALRTLKSDVITGLDPGTVAALDGTGEPWRTTGTHAVIQLRQPAAQSVAVRPAGPA